jgi:outer membrane murein-binding lipoprotein Lpp
MSTKNTVQIDARREEFRKYLEKEGILESLTKSLVALYEEPDKPSDALSFVRNIFAASEMQTMRSQVENLTKENEQLKTKVSTLETDKAVLEKKIVQMEEAVAAAKDEKKDESPASPKQVDEGDVSNETPQESVSVSAEESTTSPTKEASSDVPTAETTESRNAVVPVEETKIAEDVTEPPTPVATKDSEEPTNSSDAMETDAPAPEQESSNNAAA